MMKHPGIWGTKVSPAILLLLLIVSCSKSDSGGGGNPPPPNPCANVNITVTLAAQHATACLNNGKITVTASGSSNLQYSINGTVFQASNVFDNVAAGQYTVTVKNNTNCSKTATVTINSEPGNAGPLFTAAKSVIGTICIQCHAPGGQMPSINFTNDCTIIANATRIKVRAVDEGTMPPTGPLSQADKDKIAAWVNAGGKITD